MQWDHWLFSPGEGGTTTHYVILAAAAVAGLALAVWAVAAERRLFRAVAGVLCLPALAYAGWGAYCLAQSQPPSRVVTERWDAIYMGGLKAGYIHTQVTSEEKDGRSLRQVMRKYRQIINRYGERFEIKLEIRSTETADGQLLTFATTGELGEQPLRMAGRVVDGQLRIHAMIADNQQQQTIPWSADIGGPLAVEQSLQSRPMQSGEKRQLKNLEPLFHQVMVTTVDLVARDYETTKLLDREATLLRIDATVSLPGQGKVPQVLWTDKQGRVVKASMPRLRQEVFKSSKFEATKEPQGELYDIGLAMSVRVTPPPKDLHKARYARYRLRLQTGNPLTIFPSGATQRVSKTANANTVEVAVRAIRPDTPGVAEETRPKQGDTEPNRLIQSDDKRVVRMSREVAAGERDPWKIALALEKHVSESMEVVNFSKPLVTAAEVAEELEGDCTEHAILLAALARARGIPARVALGLVYDGVRFAFHMWTEVYVADRWVPLDATRGEGGIGVGHLKLTHSNLQGEDGGLASLWRVGQVMGQIDLEILEVE